MRNCVIPLLLVLASCAPAVAPGPEQAAGLAAKTVALIHHDTGRPYCSGVWVGQETIVTASHCVDDIPIGSHAVYAVRSDIGFENQPVGRVSEVFAKDSKHDLALLRAVIPPLHQVAKVRLAPIQQGQATQSMGHPKGWWWSYSTGVVSAVRYDDLGELNLLWVQSTAPISPGNSGGGLFDDNGDLIGLCRGTHPNGQNLNIFVHSRYVSDILRRNAHYSR